METLYNFTDGLSIRLKNPLEHPAFVWPQTLLHYSLDLSKSSNAKICVYDENENVIPSQLVYNGTDKGDLYFLTELLPGQAKTFTLREGDTACSDGIEKSICDNGIILSNGNFSIKIPRDDIAYKKIPAPLISVCQNGHWMGDNFINVTDNAHICVTEKIFGPIFAQYEVSYSFGDNKTYTVCIKFIKGYDFVEIWETANNIVSDDDLNVEYAWTNFCATHKYMSTWPDDFWELQSDTYGDYPWNRVSENPCHCYFGEDPRFQGGNLYGEDSVGHDGDAIRFGPYAPFFAYSIRPCGAYWDENTGQSLGIFVNGNENWNDEKYEIWATGNTLAGHYYYKNDTVIWRLPIASGKRSICISCYSREKDLERFLFLQNLKDKLIDMGVSKDEAKKLTAFPTSYTAYLHNWYVTLNLDKVKDWQLTYDGKHPDTIPFPDKSLKTADELYNFIISTGRTAIATKGTEEFHERPYTFEAVEIRTVYDIICDSYLRLYKELSPKKLKEVNALLLITAYVCAGEEAIPMQNILGGHPNFLTDIKCTPALIAFMFPEHRDAEVFADTFEKFIDLNTRYHMRPAVNSWNALGGRWTEAIGIYTWAFLSPTALTATLLKAHYDGKSRLATERISSIVKWIIGISSAPILLNGKFVRALSTQGAHSDLRAIPKIFRLIAQQLRNFDPLLADNMYYITQNSTDFLAENNKKHIKWSYLYDDDAVFARPELESSKYTGYGSIMRYKPYTENEMSVYLQQIDAGPNYRWGYANDGGCGSIFYYADGKCFSYNGKENAGDRRSEDTSLTTCFGVWKEHQYRSIGQNTLCEPLLALGKVQYQKITSDTKKVYSFPEYQYRSVLMLGGDYIVTYDSVSHPNVFTRFSWFVKKDDEYPFIHFVKGITMDRYGIKNYAMTEHFTPQSKGKWFEGSGDCMAVISHRSDLEVSDTDYGCIVTGADLTDYIINDVKVHTFMHDNIEFIGKIGVIRKSANGNTTVSVIDGSSIRIGDFFIQTKDVSLCLTFTQNRIYGKVYIAHNGNLQISGVNAPIYIDFECAEDLSALPCGTHTIEITDAVMTPSKPIILGISGRKVKYAPSKGADRHIFEYSTDGANFTETTEYEIFHLKQKAILRIKGISNGVTSEYSNEYPYLPVSDVPAPPDGLRIYKKTATWGKVYGVTEYRLYKLGSNTPLYSGKENTVTVDGKGVYYVTSVNEYGESLPSYAFDCQNPILNFYPPTYGQAFSREYAYLKPPYYTGEKPDLTYPD